MFAKEYQQFLNEKSKIHLFVFETCKFMLKQLVSSPSFSMIVAVTPHRLSAHRKLGLFYSSIITFSLYMIYILNIHTIFGHANRIALLQTTVLASASGVDTDEARLAVTTRVVHIVTNTSLEKTLAPFAADHSVVSA